MRLVMSSEWNLLSKSEGQKNTINQTTGEHLSWQNLMGNHHPSQVNPSPSPCTPMTASCWPFPYWPNLVARFQLCYSWIVHICQSVHPLIFTEGTCKSYNHVVSCKRHCSNDKGAYNTCCSYEYLRLSSLPKVSCSWELCWPPRTPCT